MTTRYVGTSKASTIKMICDVVEKNKDLEENSKLMIKILMKIDGSNFYKILKCIEKNIPEYIEKLKVKQTPKELLDSLLNFPQIDIPDDIFDMNYRLEKSILNNT